MAKTVHYKGLRIKAKHHKKLECVFEVAIYKGRDLLFHALTSSELDALAEGFLHLQNNPDLVPKLRKVQES